MPMMRRFAPLCLGVLITWGCGSVKNGHLPDAPPPPPDAPSRGTVHVTVLDPGGSGAPAVGASVVFLDPGGTVVKRVATDAAGKADADVLPGASVTSIARINATVQLQTVLAIKPGDDIILGIKNADSSAAGTFTISYPPSAGAGGYEIAYPCGPSFVSPTAAGAPPPTSVSLSMFNSCKLDTMEIVVTPTDANFVPTQTLSKPAVSFVSGGSTTLTGSYQGLRTFTASYTNINPIVTSMTISRAVPDAFGITTSQSMASPTVNQVLSTTGASGSNARIVSRFSTATRSLQEVRQNLAGTAATYGLDATANLLPWVDQPTLDVANRKLVVPLDMTGTSGNPQPDFFRVSAAYRRTDMNQVTTVYAWTIFGPQAGDTSLPLLPAEVGDVFPLATDTIGTVSAAMVEVDTVAGYDAVRNDLNAAFLLYTGSRAPTSSLIRMSQSPPILR